jgi:hypothetical protein
LSITASMPCRLRPSGPQDTGMPPPKAMTRAGAPTDDELHALLLDKHRAAAFGNTTRERTTAYVTSTTQTGR